MFKYIDKLSRENKTKSLIFLLILIIFIPSIGIYNINPEATNLREAYGYIAYALPIIATIIAGQSLFVELKYKSHNNKKNAAENVNEEKEGKDEQGRRFAVAVFLESLVFYFFGIYIYCVYILWDALEKKHWLIGAFSIQLIGNAFALALALKYGFRREQENPYLRWLLIPFLLIFAISGSFVIIARCAYLKLAC